MFHSKKNSIFVTKLEQKQKIKHENGNLSGFPTLVWELTI